MRAGLKAKLERGPNLLYPLVFACIFAVLGVSYLLLTHAATSKTSDLNNDGVVNIYDLGILLSNYNKTGANVSDLNGDNVVNIYDLGILLSNYGKPVVTAPLTGFSPGINAGSAHAYSLIGFKAIGSVPFARVEWDLATPASSLQQDISDYADAGVSIVPMAGFNAYTPTDAQAQNLATWAAAYGPGGTFWVSREQSRKNAGLSDDSNLAVKLIEFGNETNMGWQYGDNWDSPSYIQRAKDYALRFKSAQIAIKAANANVGLLAQGDDGATGSSNWVDGMFSAVPDLTSANRVAGWTIHPYGLFDCTATYKPFSTCNTNNGNYGDRRIKRMLQQLSAHGAPDTIPIDITEYGISTNNGAALTDNYGWPVDLTYAQAAADLDMTVNSFINSPDYGSRIRLFLYYGIMDLNFNNPSDNDREHFFGAVNVNFGDKGAYTTEIRKIMKM